MSVRAFQPRSIDPPQFIAEDLDALVELQGSFVDGEQCDGCGNHSYRVAHLGGSQWVAVCELDPDEDPEFRHPEPCGHAWPIRVWDDDLVAF